MIGSCPLYSGCRCWCYDEGGRSHGVPSTVNAVVGVTLSGEEGSDGVPFIANAAVDVTLERSDGVPSIERPLCGERRYWRYTKGRGGGGSNGVPFMANVVADVTLRYKLRFTFRHFFFVLRAIKRQERGRKGGLWQ